MNDDNNSSGIWETILDNLIGEVEHGLFVIPQNDGWSENVFAKVYDQKGQTINPSSDCVIGAHVSLSSDSSRMAMAVSSSCKADSSVQQAYQFQSGKWRRLGDTIGRTFRGQTMLQHVTMSSDGSRIAVSWYVGTMVYELQ